MSYDVSNCGYFVENLLHHETALYRQISQIPQCIRQISHNAPFCNRNVHLCAHFCYKVVHYGIWDWCIVGLCIWSIMYQEVRRDRQVKVVLTHPMCSRIRPPHLRQGHFEVALRHQPQLTQQFLPWIFHSRPCFPLPVAARWVVELDIIEKFHI